MGQNDNNFPAINEFVSVLDAVNPGLLSKFRSDSKEIGAQLELGQDAGGEPATGALPASALKELAAFVLKTLQEARGRCNEGIALANRRLTLADRARFFAQCVAIVTSSSVLASIAAGYHGVELASAVLALLASLATAFAGFFIAIPGSNADVPKIASSLTELAYEIDLCAANISAIIKYSDDLQPLRQQIDYGNGLMRRVNTSVIPLLGHA